MNTCHPLRNVWAGMKSRCNNPSNPAWASYGGRGITVCERWLAPKTGFYDFVADMGERPEGHTLERIDNDLGYSPENCRWATRQEQQRNRRNTIYLTIEGKQYLLAELAERIGMKPDSIKQRAAQGLSLAEIFDKNPRKNLSGLALGGAANGARQKSKTHCPKGHEYSEDNLLANKYGHRRCKICHKESESIRRSEKAKKQ